MGEPASSNLPEYARGWRALFTRALYVAALRRAGAMNYPLAPENIWPLF